MESGTVLLAHGDGGLLTSKLLEEVFTKHLKDEALLHMTDAAVLSLPGQGLTGRASAAGCLAFTTDSFVVKPIFFPGGDIGKLAVAGTVNDLSVMGAEPLYLSAGFILEEGFPLEQLERVVISMAETAREAGIRIVAGDTKVVERGHGDGLFINTSGIGVVIPEANLGYDRIQEGDLVVINGPVGLHGAAILCRRKGIEFDSPVESDCAPLNRIILSLLKKFPGIKFMRDATRGGLATVLKEAAVMAGKEITLFEEDIPVSEEVQGIIEMLGLDSLYLANEGKFVAIVEADEAEAVVRAMREFPEGAQAAIIGRVKKGGGDLFLKTTLGGNRYLDLLAGEQLPRIC